MWTAPYLMLNRGTRMGPMGIIDTVGMKTVFDITNHWGHVHKDQQTLKNASYIKTHMIETGRVGLMAGRGYYDYPNPAYEASDFLSVPPHSSVPQIVARAPPKN
jgi:3-hydroxybutyryl-CoA dehydrogenase